MSHNFYTSNQDLEEDENVFNNLLLYPFAKAVGKAVARDVDGCNAEFKTGETYLQAMTNQLKSMGLYKDDKSQYKADGLVKLYGLEKLEIVLLETSSHFGNTDQSKISYDHHKGLFGSLAMLKTVADEFSLASMDIFRKIKVFFVHGAGREVLLWSLRFEPEGPTYELWLERSFEINPSFHKRADALPKFINFYWAMVGLVKESAQNIKCLKEDHYTTMRSVRFVQNISLPSLSAAVNPSILRLTEEEDKQGMAQLGPFYFIPLPQSP